MCCLVKKKKPHFIDFNDNRLHRIDAEFKKQELLKTIYAVSPNGWVYEKVCL